MFLTDHIYAILLIGGPILLAAVLIWARVKNKATPHEEARSEQATRDLYRDQARQDGTGPGTET